MSGVCLSSNILTSIYSIYAAPAWPDKLASVAIECLLLLLFKSQHRATRMKSTFQSLCQALLWMDELGFYVPSIVFQSFRDDGRVNMKGSVQ